MCVCMSEYNYTPIYRLHLNLYSFNYVLRNETFIKETLNSLRSVHEHIQWKKTLPTFWSLFQDS